MDRKRILLETYGWYADGETPLQELLYLSKCAMKLRKDKIDAAKDNKKLIY